MIELEKIDKKYKRKPKSSVEQFFFSVKLFCARMNCIKSVLYCWLEQMEISFWMQYPRIIWRMKGGFLLYNFWRKISYMIRQNLVRKERKCFQFIYCCNQFQFYFLKIKQQVIFRVFEIFDSFSFSKKPIHSYQEVPVLPFVAILFYFASISNANFSLLFECFWIHRTVCLVITFVVYDGDRVWLLMGKNKKKMN